MKLLHFAHRGEAQSFLKGAKLIDEKLLLYQNESELIFISGEGQQRSMALLAYILGKYPSIDHVINFGIAGALSKQLELGQIYQIRTIYAENEFKSFTSSQNDGLIDCITSKERVLDEEYAKKLSFRAGVVDRELWSIAYTCDLNNIKFDSYKLISDFAGTQTNCFDLKGRALEFSNFLYQYYLGMNSNSQKVDDPLSKSLYLSEQLALLPISFTMKKNLEKLITKIALKENLLEKDLCDQILRVCDSSWKKTEYKTLIQKLEIRLAPHRLLMLNALTEFQNKFENIGANILYDSSFEKEEFTLQMLVNSESNLKKLGKICHETSFEDFSKIIQGDLGV